jgi:hypothetical protein
VPKSQISRLAEETGATPFDAQGVELGHHDNKCSFETIIEHFGLMDKALLRLAKIVHAADVQTDRNTDRVAVGLEAIAVGYGLRFPNDLENLERQFDVYDALYAWCKLLVDRVCSFGLDKGSVDCMLFGLTVVL